MRALFLLLVAANLALDAAQAEYESLDASLQNDLLGLRSALAAIEAALGG